MVKNIPTVLVIFGATGDLISKKIAPALYHLFTKNKLPNMFKVIGYSRRDWTDEDFREHIREIIRNHKHIVNKTQLEQFASHFFYHGGNFDDKNDYTKLAGEVIVTSVLLFLIEGKKLCPITVSSSIQ